MTAIKLPPDMQPVAFVVSIARVYFLRRSERPKRQASPAASIIMLVGSGTTWKLDLITARSWAESVNTSSVPSVEATAPPGTAKLSKLIAVPLGAALSV